MKSFVHIYIYLDMMLISGVHNTVGVNKSCRLKEIRAKKKKSCSDEVDGLLKRLKA